MDWFNDLPDIVRWAVYVVCGGIIIGFVINLLIAVAVIIAGALTVKESRAQARRRRRLGIKNRGLRGGGGY